jgi:hypothetical protein
VDHLETTVNLQHLLLDPNNYRFQDEQTFLFADEKRFHEPSVQERAYNRIRTEGISDLKNSILTNGFLPFERVVVRPYAYKAGDDGDYYVVVEGNRRIAALKWIADDHAAGVTIPSQVVDTLDNIPVIVIDSSSDPSIALSLMGVRHVGGIREWGGYQRAKLVAELRDQFGLETPEIAARLGMSAHEVNRRYRAFKSLEQMQRDEEFGDQAIPKMYPLFHEAVAGTVIKDWLKWSETETRFEDLESLHSFYSLIVTRETEDGETIEPKIQTREAVRDLRDIIPVSEARRVLFDPDKSYSDALALAKAEELSRSWAVQVAEAIAALRSVSALDVKKLTDEDLTALQHLKDAAAELLETNQILTGHSDKS